LPKLSVIIPTYNNDRYIQRAISSLLEQSFKDFEIIIVDDGSTDDTRDIVKAYGDSIRYIYQENKGLAGARNTGIDVSNGELLAFLDADDWFAKKNLETKVSFLEKNPDAVWVYSDWQFVDAQGNHLDRGSTRFKFADKKVDGYVFAELLYNRNFISPCAVVIKKSVLEEVGCFDPQVVCQEDWDLWLRLSLRYPCNYIDEALVYVFDRPHSLSKDFTKWAYGNAFIVDKLENLIPHDFERRKQALARLQADKHTFLARVFIKKGQIKNGLRAYFTSIRHLPYQKRVYWLVLMALARFILERKKLR
jgi:glycosyltransferase involved in cell wall biosynthesis